MARLLNSMRLQKNLRKLELSTFDLGKNGKGARNLWREERGSGAKSVAPHDDCQFSIQIEKDSEQMFSVYLCIKNQ